jgi:ribonuclease P protein component
VWSISDRATFQALRRGRRARVGPITVTWVLDEGPGPVRVGYAIGRPVGNAVQRNRLRRRLRAVVAELAGDLSSGAYLIGVKPEATAMSFNELQVTARRAFGQVRAGESRRPPAPADVPDVPGVKATAPSARP